MEVWEPKDEMTVFSQIKSLILSAERALTGWVVRLYPGNLVFRVKDYFYYLCEHHGGSISCWAWHKRWNKKNTKWYKSRYKYEKPTHSEEMQDKLEPIDEN